VIGWSRDLDDAGWRTWEPPSRDAPDRDALRRHLSGRIWRDAEMPAPIVEVRIGKRRQSKRGMTALYTVVFNGSPNRLVEQVYIGYEFQPGALDAEYASARAEATVVPALGQAVVRVPEANLLLVAFPNDRQMRVPDEAALRACVARIGPGRTMEGSQPCRLADSAFSVLRYVPGQRLTLRCRGRFETGPGTYQPFAFIAKQFSKADAARAVHASLVALDAHDSATTVRLPRPMGFDEQTGLVLMEELAGQDLLRALGQIDLGETMRAAGRLLAAFHQLPHVVGRRVSAREKLDEVRDVARKIETYFPAVLPRLRACFDRCLAFSWNDESPAVLLHGAFRPKHVFLHQGRLALIDVDGMRVGHPAHDIGHFLSALFYLEAQELLTTAERGIAVDRFLDGYSAHAPWPIEPAAVLWCTAALLVHKQARKYVVHLHGDRAEKVDRVLALAEGALAACETLRCGASLDVVRRVLG